MLPPERGVSEQSATEQHTVGLKCRGQVGERSPLTSATVGQTVQEEIHGYRVILSSGQRIRLKHVPADARWVIALDAARSMRKAIRIQIEQRYLRLARETSAVQEVTRTHAHIEMPPAHVTIVVFENLPGWALPDQRCGQPEDIPVVDPEHER